MTRGEYDTWTCRRCKATVDDPAHTCVGIGSTAKLTITAALIGLAGLTLSACDPHDPTGTGGTVTGTEYDRDPNNPATGTHYAECTGPDGTQYRVIVSAATEYSLHRGQPCPDGPHVPTVRQENPELYDEIQSALNQPLPYHGGDSNGPCWAWSAPDKATADQARAEWNQCMANGGLR